MEPELWPYKEGEINETAEWMARIRNAFPRGFHVVQLGNPDVVADIRMVAVHRMEGGRPEVTIAALPAGGKFCVWVLESVQEVSDRAWWVISRAGVGRYLQRWAPLTDDEHQSFVEVLGALDREEQQAKRTPLLLKPTIDEDQEAFTRRVLQMLGLPNEESE